MQYKTIVLELIEERPELHEQLRSSNTLLSTVNRLATVLRGIHLATIDQLRQTRPGSAEPQLSSEALELALQQLRESLPSNTDEEGMLSLDEAMLFIRHHTPPA
jgi:hypothetical protein